MSECIHDRVVALIPTYNRKALLARCLRSLFRQTYPLHRIYIVDNAGEDGTRDYLRCQGLLQDGRVCYLRLKQNSGSAGAYYAGMGCAVAGGADWVWLVDDDSEARPDTLERLITPAPARDPDTVAVAPSLVFRHDCVWTDTRGHFRPQARRWPWDLQGGLVPLGAGPDDRRPRRIDWTLGLGLLIRSDAIARVGLPRRQFFYGYTDIEYTLRLSRAGAVWYIPAGTFVDTGKRNGRTPVRRRWLRRLLPVPPEMTPLESYWRDVLARRNFAWVMKRYGAESLPRSLLRLIVIAAVTAVCDDHPLLRLRWLFAFYLQARLESFRRMTPQLWQDILHGER
jgi:GT2 family glycosyltransferase